MHGLNPYFGTDFFKFFTVLCVRLKAMCLGQLPLSEFASDELQLFVLAGVGVSGALVGCFMMLRQLAMLANSLSHTILLGVVIAFVLFGKGGHSDSHSTQISIKVFLIAAFLMGLVTTYLTELLTRFLGVSPDASNGLVFSTLFALGIVAATVFARDAHMGTEVVLGNASLLHVDDLKLVFWVLLINICLFFLFYKEYKLTTFDAPLAKSLGISVSFFNYLLMVQVAIVTVGGLRAVGVLMVLSLIIGPPLTARLLTNSLGKMLILSSALGLMSALIGVALARHILSFYQVSLSIGGMVVCVVITCYFLAVFLAPRRGVLAQIWNRMKIRHRLSDS